jgi:hypothetical protein
VHLLGIACGLGGRRAFEGVFDEVFAVGLQFPVGGARAAALFFVLPTPPGHKAPEWAPARQFLRRI